MEIYDNYSLKEYNSFGFNVRARRFISVGNEEDILAAAEQAVKSGLKYFILGAGSNILFTSDYDGVIINASCNSVNIVEEKNRNIVVSADAGLTWDSFVEWCVNINLGGVENLSSIPGTVGAAPVQNIGAYGSEIKDVLRAVRAIRLSTGKAELFSANDCRFSYRESIFKNELKGKYFISKVYFNLIKNPDQFNTQYGNLEERVNRIGKKSLHTIRQAVMEIRGEKLPDPAITGNAGSFFKNPVINRQLFKSTHHKNREMPYYETNEDHIKIPAGWLIEECGWKGFRDGDAGVHNKQALVLVNYGNATGIEILNLAERIIESVNQRFGIELKKEVEIV